MRILFTITGPWGTGAATVVNGLAKELIKGGHAVKVAFPDRGLPSPDAAQYYDSELYHIVSFPRTYGGVDFPTFPLMIPDPNPRNLPNAWTYRDLNDTQFDAFRDLLHHEIGALAASFRPDIVDTQHLWLMGSIVRELGIPYVAGAHHSDQMGFHYDERMRPYAISCARGARYIWALSSEAKQEIEALYGVAADRVIELPNGYDQDIFAPRALDRRAVFEAHGIDADPDLPVVSFVGKVSRTKGFDTLIDANVLVQDDVPCTMLLFGSGALADLYGHAPPHDRMRRMHLMGHHPPEVIADMLNISDLTVLPSREEGFGIAALESMGCGVPVVATRVGELKRFVVGTLVEPGDHATLARAIVELLRASPEKRNTLRTRAHETALCFSWSGIANRRFAYYERAIAENA